MMWSAGDIDIGFTLRDHVITGIYLQRWGHRYRLYSTRSRDHWYLSVCSAGDIDICFTLKDHVITGIYLFAALGT